MNTEFLQVVERPPKVPTYIDELFDRSEKIIRQHCYENPDLYQMIEARKLVKEINEKQNLVPAILHLQEREKLNPPQLIESIYFKQLKQTHLKNKIAANQKLIHEHVSATQSIIVHRTQARNVKQPFVSIESMTADRADKVEAQIQAWRSVLPMLVKRFSKIHDPRRAKSVKHQVAVVMLYGLFAFIFRLSSRREINRELTGMVIFNNLKKLFPELNSIPHADTLARVLEKIDVNEIESAHILLINRLIRNKKFKKSLIQGCLPIALDGTQKLYREGELQDLRWLHRNVGNKESESNQQYVYVLEANIVFKNGLTIPLLTEYLKTDWNCLNNGLLARSPRKCTVFLLSLDGSSSQRYYAY